MADYSKPPFNRLPFRFGTGGYSAPDFNDVGFKFKERAIVSTYAGTSATIVGVRDYIKECPTYVVGYGPYGVQIIKGKCIWGGIRDVGAYIFGVAQSGQGNLGAIIQIGANEKDLTGIIRGVVERNLSASISAHPPQNLGALVNALTYEDLGATISPIPGGDLGGYIQVYPQRDLGANIYGWEQRDLGATIKGKAYGDLVAIIGIHSPRDLGARLKGWVREATRDLGAYIRAYQYKDLGANIRATYLDTIGGYINPVTPVDLTATIYGWDTKDLTALINGVKLPTDLGATIVVSGAYDHLGAYLRARAGTEVPSDLGARITSFYEKYLGAYINPKYPGNLGANLTVDGASGLLGATIYPKMVKITTVISFVTMEHKNMGAYINICFGSESRNLGAYLQPLRKSDLGATIYGEGLYQEGTKNLGASTGTASEYFTIDKLPLSVYIGEGSYWTEDKLPIGLYLSVSSKRLGAYINAVQANADLGASIGSIVPEPYGFNNTKNREFVYYRSYLGEKLRFETAEISFRQMVADYFYVSAENKVYRTDRLDRWITDVKSYIPKNERLNIKRRLHRMTTIHDISSFSSIDEAMKFAIDYVTAYPAVDMGARITGSGSYKGMGAVIKGIQESAINLTSSIVVM